MTIEEAQKIIEAQEREIKMLRNGARYRPNSDVYPNGIDEKYPYTFWKLRCEMNLLTRIIRMVCFPKSAYRKAGKYKAEATMQVKEMNAEQYALYSDVFVQILEVLEKNAYMTPDDIACAEKIYGGRN